MFKKLSVPRNIFKIMLTVGLIWLIAEVIQDTQAAYVEPVEEDYEYTWEDDEAGSWDDWEYDEDDQWDDDWESDESDLVPTPRTPLPPPPLPNGPPTTVVPDVPPGECPFDPRDPTDPYHPENPDNDLWWNGPEGFYGPLWPLACFPPDMPSPAEIPPEGRWVYPPSGPDGLPDGEPVLIFPIPGMPAPPCPYEPCRFDPDDPTDPLHPDNPANDYTWHDSRFTFQWPADCIPTYGLIPVADCPFDPLNQADPLHPENPANDLTWWGPEGRGTSSWVPSWPTTCFPIDMPIPECPYDPFDPTDPDHPENPTNDYTWEFSTFHPGCQIPGTPGSPGGPGVVIPGDPAPPPPPEEPPLTLPPGESPPPDMGDSEDMIVLPGPEGDLEIPPVQQVPPGEQAPPEDEQPPETGGGRWNRRRWRNRHGHGRRWRNGEGCPRHRSERHFGEWLVEPEQQLDEEQLNGLERQPGGWRNRSDHRFGERRGNGRRWRNSPGWNWDNPGAEDATGQELHHNAFGN